MDETTRGTTLRSESTFSIFYAERAGEKKKSKFSKQSSALFHVNLRSKLGSCSHLFVTFELMIVLNLYDTRTVFQVERMSVNK